MVVGNSYRENGFTNNHLRIVCREEQIQDPPADHRLVKLLPFIDSWIHGFTFTGESKPCAIFRCDQKTTKWGLGWKNVAEGRAIIMPMLGNDSPVHSTIGLSAVELQGIDNETVVLVVEEKLPKSDKSITYGLILDLAKLKMNMCLTLTEKGLLYFPEDRAQWTP